ncbi:hypothetical protein CY35_03G023700 [Sphagnum magellanicum]|nr:hypothetical protein CY35_03G023700 [Sphagnum magellanicum]
MTVRYWRPGSPAWYVTANPKNVEYMLKTNFANYPKGPETCNNLNDLLGRGIFSVDGELWKLQRKVAIHEFTTRSLRNFMQQIVQVELDTRLIPLLSHTCSAGVVVDLQDLLCRFTFDTICKLAFGIDPECLHISLPAVEFAHAFDTATKISSSRFYTYPFIWRTLRALNVGSERKLREAIHQIDEFAMSLIHKRKQQMQQQSTAAADQLHHMDLLSRFLLLSFDESKRASSDVVTNDSATPPESGPEAIFSDVFLRDIVISFVLAGRDTSSSGISWFFWLLSRNRHVEDSIRAEIAEIVRSRNHHDHDHVANNKKDTISKFTYEELKKMHYLEAAMTESMRLYPPVPFDSKVAMEEDTWPDGTHIPKDSVVAYAPYAMGRMEQLWGSDCLEFKPERWLDDNGVFQPESPYKYAVFQAGQRVCLGKELAMLQMKLLVATIVSHFTISVSSIAAASEAADAQDAQDDDDDDFKPTYEISLTLPIKNGLPVRIHLATQDEDIKAKASKA